MYVYKQTEFSPYCLYTVGFYDPSGTWVPESDHETEGAAASRVILLNTGYTKDDLLKAFNAGTELVHQAWHMEEFHGANCKCEKLDYKSFEEWHNKNYKI